MVPHHSELVGVAEMTHTNYQLSLRALGSSAMFGRKSEKRIISNDNFIKTVCITMSYFVFFLCFVLRAYCHGWTLSCPQVGRQKKKFPVSVVHQ